MTTTNHGFSQQAFRTTAWHTQLNLDLASIDARLPFNYAGNPTTHVAGLYVGQLIFDSTNSNLYVCTTAGIAAAAVWSLVSGTPVGGIIMWSGEIADIPSGFDLCDGSGGTPDLRDKFIVGAKQDDSGAAKTNVTGALTISGGAASVTSGAGGAHDHGANTGSTAADLAAHTHAAGTLATASNGDHSHTTNVPLANGQTTGTPMGNNTGVNIAYPSNTTGAHTHTISGSTASAGTGPGHAHTITATVDHTHSVDTLPPYYALAFIMRTS